MNEETIKNNIAILIQLGEKYINQQFVTSNYVQIEQAYEYVQYVIITDILESEYINEPLIEEMLSENYEYIAKHFTTVNFNNTNIVDTIMDDLRNDGYIISDWMSVEDHTDQIVSAIAENINDTLKNKFEK